MHPNGDTSVREALKKLPPHKFSQRKTTQIKNTYRKQIPNSPLFFLFQCLYAKILQYDYSLWCILGWIFLGVHLFLDILGRTIIPGYSWIFLGVQLFLRSCTDQEKRSRKSSNFGFVGLCLYF